MVVMDGQSRCPRLHLVLVLCRLFFVSRWRARPLARSAPRRLGALGAQSRSSSSWSSSSSSPSSSFFFSFDSDSWFFVQCEMCTTITVVCVCVCIWGGARGPRTDNELQGRASSPHSNRRCSDPPTTPPPPPPPPHFTPCAITCPIEGWANVGFHNFADVLTPNTDHLAASGVILDRHYTYRWCAPTRSALMTGRLPYHVLQDTDHVDRGFSMLPAKLRQVGYGDLVIVFLSSHLLVFCFILTRWLRGYSCVSRGVGFSRK